MAGFAIGKKLGLGVVGGLTRQIDNVIINETNKDTVAINFGVAVVRAEKGCKNFAATNVAADVLGISLRIVKTNETYAQNDAKYVVNDEVDILTRGGVLVECVMDATATTQPVAGGKVFIRLATGAFVAKAESTDTIQLTDAIWAGERDFNGLAEITLLARKA